jgi:hypothetical protein
MKLPEFTADASLYKVLGCYETAGNIIDPTGNLVIVPQLRLVPRPWWIPEWFYVMECEANDGGMVSLPDGSTACALDQ